MAGLHLWRELDGQEQATRLRAEIAARTLAKVAAPALATNDVGALTKAVAACISDDEILYTRILDRNTNAVYRPWKEAPPPNLLWVSAAVGPSTNQLGTVELGIGRAS